MSAQTVTRREFLAGAGAAVASLPLLNVGSAFGASKRPNFVFILTDDQRYDFMSCAGHPFLHTPNMDRIAEEGTRFTNAFVTIALCSPSRACFLTGRYAHSHGVITNGIHLSDDIPTFPQGLQKAGYDTAFIGKWHMDGQEGPRPGFNRWVSFKGQGIYFNPTLNIDGDKREVTGYMTDLLTEYAVEWLKQPRKSPFCLYLSHKAVHDSWTPAVRHSKLFEDVPIPRPKSMSDTLEGKPAWVSKRQEIIPGTRGGPDNYDDFVRDYTRCVMAVDDGVGRVLDTLENLGVLDDTVVVFASDNGFFLGEHGLLDKRSMYEESIRIALTMRYPRMIRPGTLIDRMVLNIDICPTFLDLAGAEIPEGVQGRSLRPLLRGRTSGWRSDWLFEYFKEPNPAPATVGVRTERWTYIEYLEEGQKWELYDLKNDLLEMHNLIDDPRHAGVLVEMRSRLERLKSETGYKLPEK